MDKNSVLSYLNSSLLFFEHLFCGKLNLKSFFYCFYSAFRVPKLVEALIFSNVFFYFNKPSTFDFCSCFPCLVYFLVDTKDVVV